MEVPPSPPLLLEGKERIVLRLTVSRLREVIPDPDVAFPDPIREGKLRSCEEDEEEPLPTLGR
jgi:hypothetical protein